MRNRVWTLVLAVAVCLLSGCTAGGPAEQDMQPEGAPSQPAAGTADTVIILRHDGDEGSVTHMGALRFKGELERLSGGGIKVDIYPANRLGNRQDTEYALRYGTVTMHMGEPLYTSLRCLEWVPLAGSLEAYQANILSGPVRELVDAECAENGTEFLGVVTDEYQILSSTRPVRTAGDLQGLRIASTGAQGSEAFWQALGAQVVVSPKRQFYTAVQQGVVDAQEDTLQYSMAEQFSRYHPYVTQSRHRIASRVMYINRRFYSELPPGQREMVGQAIDEVRRYLGEYLQSTEGEILRLLGENGTAVDELPDTLRGELWQQARPSLIAALREIHGEQPVDALLEALAA